MKLVLIVILLGLSGCGDYWMNRAADMFDCHILKVGPSMGGIHAYAEVTPYFKPSFGGSIHDAHPWNFGKIPDKNSWGSHLNSDSYSGWSLFFCSMETPCLLGGYRGRDSASRVRVCGVPVKPIYAETNVESKAVDLFDVGLGFTAIFFNLNIGLSPGQIADFLLGWMNIDIADDDEAGKEDEDNASKQQK